MKKLSCTACAAACRHFSIFTICFFVASKATSSTPCVSIGLLAWLAEASIKTASEELVSRLRCLSWTSTQSGV